MPNLVLQFIYNNYTSIDSWSKFKISFFFSLFFLRLSNFMLFPWVSHFLSNIHSFSTFCISALPWLIFYVCFSFSHSRHRSSGILYFSNLFSLVPDPHAGLPCFSFYMCYWVFTSSPTWFLPLYMIASKVRCRILESLMVFLFIQVVPQLSNYMLSSHNFN